MIVCRLGFVINPLLGVVRIFFQGHTWNSHFLMLEPDFFMLAYGIHTSSPLDVQLRKKNLTVGTQYISCNSMPKIVDYVPRAQSG